jgi:tetratricopeptide (TPR) repeat protein
MNSRRSLGGGFLFPWVPAAVIADRGGIMETREFVDRALESTSNWHFSNRVARTLINALYLLAENSRDGAAEIYAEMEPLAGRLYWAGSCDAILGRLARLLDRPDDASRHFEDAIAFCEKAPYPPELAWAQYHYADFLLNRTADGDRDRATELQDEAIVIAQDIGMKLLLEKVLAQREILKA